MAHDVFISHSSINKKAANAICHTLEQNGVKCWIAPRDIPPGENYGAEIIRGIKGCKVFLLVFSKDANASVAVAKEVERAVLGYKKTVIPFRIEDVALSENLEFFLTDVHWLDAFPDDKVFDNLVVAVKNALGLRASAIPSPAAVAPLAQKVPAGPDPIIVDDKFLAQELDRLTDDGDGLVYIMNTPIYSLSKPSWEQYVFLKSGIVMHSTHYGASPDGNSVREGASGSKVSSGELAIKGRKIEFTLKSQSDATWEGRYKGRLQDDGSIEINGEYGREGEKSAQRAGTAYFCGTYEDGFFEPNANFGKLKTEIDKGWDG
jgi:hypothetical protein